MQREKGERKDGARRRNYDFFSSENLYISCLGCVSCGEGYFGVRESGTAEERGGRKEKKKKKRASPPLFFSFSFFLFSPNPLFNFLTPFLFYIKKEPLSLEPGPKPQEKKKEKKNKLDNKKEDFIILFFVCPFFFVSFFGAAGHTGRGGSLRLPPPPPTEREGREHTGRHRKMRSFFQCSGDGARK